MVHKINLGAGAYRQDTVSGLERTLTQKRIRKIGGGHKTDVQDGRRDDGLESYECNWRLVVDSVAGTDTGLAVFERIPCNSYARTEVLPIARVSGGRDSSVAGKDDVRRYGGPDNGLLAGPERIHPQSPIENGTKDFVAQTEVQSEMRGQGKGILNEVSIFAATKFARAIAPDLDE